MVKREQGFKKKHRHGLYYHQLLSSSQLCPRYTSFCVTLMWLERYDSYQRICTNNLSTKLVLAKYLKIEFAQWGLQGFSHPPLPKSMWDGLSITMFLAISPPTLWLHPFLVQKGFLTNPPRIVATFTALVLHKCDRAKNLWCHTTCWGWGYRTPPELH